MNVHVMVYLTPLLALLDRGYDANVGFQICLRELKSCDGIHSSSGLIVLKFSLFP